MPHKNKCPHLPGHTLYVVGSGEKKYMTISKVGRQFIYFERSRLRCEIATMQVCNIDGSGGRKRAFESEDAYEKERNREKAQNIIESKISSKKLSIEQLRAIDRIIDEGHYG